MNFPEFSETLLKWYKIHKRDLPWRKTKNPYFIWLSEIILQQTKIIQGLPYYHNFTEKYPDIHSLANATEDDVLKTWQGLGYYSRAKNLHQTAIFISKNLNGKFPTTYKDILTLKGIGDYTASAISSICYNEAQACVDGNVYRVLSRIFGIDIPINSNKGIKYFKELATNILDKNNAGEYNQAIMEFGAIWCKPKNPNCELCPFQHKCIAFHQNKIDFFPVKTKKLSIKKRFFNYCILIDSQQKTILQKRETKDIWQGLYEFPLIETTDNQEDSFIIEKIKANFQNIIKIEKYPKEYIHKLSHQHIHTFFWKIYVNDILENGITFPQINNYPKSILIVNFLKTLEV
ncbi:MAG: A/G-specific adenine glycosylase [Capnocytophaga sp.]|nr:A/G-specific adenine glycosylase [Capnocytophaga sp.]